MKINNRDIKVVGSMLVSQNAELLDITIPNLLKWCDWILILMDNESKEVIEKVNFYTKKYYKKIWVRRSSVPSQVIARSGNINNYHERWKQVKGMVRDDVFVNIRRILSFKQEEYNHIDIFIFQDHDEIFTDYLPELLERFWNSDKKAISMKPVDVVGDLYTIKRESKDHHVYIMKYDPALAGLPRRFHALYYPLNHNDLMFADYYSVHLAYLTDSNRKWRKENWKKHDLRGCELWKISRTITELNPKEIKDILNLPSNEKY